MEQQLVHLICTRLGADEAVLREQFMRSKDEVGVPHVAIDDLLPDDTARRAQAASPVPEAMRLVDSFRARKDTGKSFEKFDPLRADITFADEDPCGVELVKRITGIEDQNPDAKLHVEGLHAMTQGHFLGPLVDNLHDSARPNYRRLNLPTSWHSVSPVKADRVRRCVSNDYFSPLSPTGRDCFNITAFSTRPALKLLRAVAWADGRLGSAVRRLVPRGRGRKDVYEGPPR